MYGDRLRDRAQDFTSALYKLLLWHLSTIVVDFGPRRSLWRLLLLIIADYACYRRTFEISRKLVFDSMRVWLGLNHMGRDGPFFVFHELLVEACQALEEVPVSVDWLV